MAVVLDLDRVLPIEEPPPQFVLCADSYDIERASNSRSEEVKSKVEKRALISIDCDEESFYRYTSGRWLWDEPAQLSRRYVQFSIAALTQIAAKSVGASSCVEIKKVPEGNFNKTFLLTMNDGNEVIAKVPNPNAGRPHFNTASEVATMDFVGKCFLPSSPAGVNETSAGKKYSEDTCSQGVRMELPTRGEHGQCRVHNHGKGSWN